MNGVLYFIQQLLSSSKTANHMILRMDDTFKEQAAAWLAKSQAGDTITTYLKELRKWGIKSNKIHRYEYSNEQVSRCLHVFTH